MYLWIPLRWRFWPGSGYIYSRQRKRAERALFKLKIPSCYLSKFPGQLHLGLFSIAMDISAAYNFECAPSSPPPPFPAPPFLVANPCYRPFVEGCFGIANDCGLRDPSSRFCARTGARNESGSCSVVVLFVCLRFKKHNELPAAGLSSPISSVFFNSRMFPYLSPLSLFIFRKYPEYCEQNRNSNRERKRERVCVYIYIYIYLYAQSREREKEREGGEERRTPLHRP